ncbi:hypothetical protein [Nocardioides sp.]|jgi:hypothetical protein|uniref:hypothetical protein n=1 Tax=Nocardioides sp. TaxID=35761 RepID=UPI002D8034F4|nr:hypothetical protein [Nocardioides sp.]
MRVPPRSQPLPRVVDARFVEARAREVRAVRARLHAARDAAPRHWEAQSLREELLAALEQLAVAVARAGAPLPYRLRAEIDLYRRLGHRI